MRPGSSSSGCRPRDARRRWGRPPVPAPTAPPSPRRRRLKNLPLPTSQLLRSASRRRRSRHRSPPFGDLTPEPGLGWGSASDAPSSEEAVPLALEDLEPKPLDALTEAVEPLSGIVGMTEKDDASHVVPFDDSVGGGFHVETAEDIVLRSSGASEFQMPNASEEFFGSAFEPPPPVATEPEPEPQPEPASPAVSEPVAEHIAEPEIAHVSEPDVDESEPEVARPPEPGWWRAVRSRQWRAVRIRWPRRCPISRPIR